MIRWNKIVGFLSFMLMMTLSFFIITAPNSSAGTPVGGFIDTDTVWNKAGSPYWVESDVIVRNGTNLTIEIGIDVLFNGTHSIYIEEGAVFWCAQVSTRRYYALFTWNPDQGEGSAGSWGAIQFNGSSYDYSEVVFSRIEYATCGIKLESASPTIRNCTIRNCTNGIYSNYGSPLIKNNTVENCAEDGIYIKGYDLGNGYPTLDNNIVANNTKRGIVMYDTTKTQLRNNTIVNSSYNFGIWGDDIVEFDHDIDTTNTVDDKPIYYWKGRNNESIPSNAGYVGIVNSTNITVEDLTLTNNGQGVLVASAPANTDYIRINNVTAYDNELGIIIFGSSNDYIENCNISNNDYNGYYQSASGIYVYHSIFNTINNNTVSFNSALTGIYLETSSSNNTIDNNTAFSTGYGIIARTNSNDNTISNNTVYSNIYDGIHLFSCTDNKIDNNTVYNSTVNGIRIQASSSNTITDNTVYDTSMYYGIYLSASSTGNNLINNIVYNSDDYGIYILNSDSNYLTDNHIYDNPEGIRLSSSSHNNMTGNNISSNDKDGIYLTSSCWNDIYDNTITWNGDAGINCTSNSDNNITSNDIENNTDTGVWSEGGSDPIINYNNICNNGGGASGPGYGVYNDDSSVIIDAQYNWWGHTTGPHDPYNNILQGGDYNPNGQGDLVYDYDVYIIDYRDWIY